MAREKRPFVEKLAVLDYAYARSEELGAVIRSGAGPEREAAIERRAFLERQIGIVKVGGARLEVEAGPRAG